MGHIPLIEEAIFMCLVINDSLLRLLFVLVKIMKSFGDGICYGFLLLGRGFWVCVKLENWGSVDNVEMNNSIDDKREEEGYPHEKEIE